MRGHCAEDIAEENINSTKLRFSRGVGCGWRGGQTDELKIVIKFAVATQHTSNELRVHWCHYFPNSHIQLIELFGDKDMLVLFNKAIAACQHTTMQITSRHETTPRRLATWFLWLHVVFACISPPKQYRRENLTFTFIVGLTTNVPQTLATKSQLINSIFFCRMIDGAGREGPGLHGTPFTGCGSARTTSRRNGSGLTRSGQACLRNLGVLSLFCERRSTPKNGVHPEQGASKQSFDPVPPAL